MVITSSPLTSRFSWQYIPIDVVRCYNLKLPETLVIEDANGRRFNTQRRKWRDGRVLFYGGWKAVCKVNFVKKSDKIICEFVSGEDGNLELKVSFYHLWWNKLIKGDKLSITLHSFLGNIACVVSLIIFRLIKCFCFKTFLLTELCERGISTKTIRQLY